jgi:hypothetical protein
MENLSQVVADAREATKELVRELEMRYGAESAIQAAKVLVKLDTAERLLGSRVEIMRGN